MKRSLLFPAFFPIIMLLGLISVNDNITGVINDTWRLMEINQNYKYIKWKDIENDKKNIISQFQILEQQTKHNVINH